MIGKIARFGQNFLGALQYVYFGTKANRTRDPTTLRGELVFVQGLDLVQVADNRLRGGFTHRLAIENMAKAMQTTAALNSRLSKPVWHQSIAFPPGEQPPTETLIAICEAFVETFGLTQNQVVAFRHRDKQHDHIHLIANRVDRNGRTTAQDSHNYRRTAQFCRQLEMQLGLTPTRHLIGEELDGKRRRAAAKDSPLSESPRTQPETDRLRQAITEAKSAATDMLTFLADLKQRGYTAVISERTGVYGQRKAGIVYGKQFAGGAERWVKGSTLGPECTHRGLLSFFEQKQTDAVVLSTRIVTHRLLQ